MEKNTRIGDYTLLAEIGQGGMGDVYLATKNGPAGLRKLLVLKILRPALAADPEFLAMFFDEARLAARLHHPNIVQCYEVGRHEDLFYIVLEYLNGQPLSRIMSRLMRGGFPDSLRFSMTVMIETLCALEYAHNLQDFDGSALKIVHRDISPQNIFITYDGEVKLMDFGIAKAIDSRTVTRAGSFKGKLAYCAPEQVASEGVDHRGDLFSMGVILFEMLAKKRMWGELSDSEIMNCLVHREIPQFMQGAPGVSTDLVEVVQCAIAADPLKRYRDASLMRSELRRAFIRNDNTMDREEIGGTLQAMFGEERKKLQSVIEQQFRGSNGSESQGDSSQKNSLEPLPVLGHTTGASKNGASSASPSVPLHQDITVDYRLPSTAGIRRSRFNPATVLIPLAVVVMAGIGWFFFGNSILFRAIATGENRTHLISADTDPLSVEEVPIAAISQRTKALSFSSRPVVELTGELLEDTSLSNKNDYLLTGILSVGPGVSLMIQPGTSIYGDTQSRGTLIVRPGSRLIASGTAEEPIVFTSAAPKGEQRPGDWGGLLIFGEAPVSTSGASRAGTGQARFPGVIEHGIYGGSNPDDSSGMLEYVRIEYAGAQLAPNRRLNALTLAGAGRLTRINHVSILSSGDDCFEFIGGTVNASHLICQDPVDDAFEWGDGYTGQLQFLLAIFGANATEASNGIEGRGVAEKDANLLSGDHPEIFNATLCGGDRKDHRQQYGLLMRQGTCSTVANAVVTGFSAGIDVRERTTRPRVVSSVFYGNHKVDFAYPETEDGGGRLEDDDQGFDEVAELQKGKHPSRTEDPGLPGCGRYMRSGHKPQAPVARGALVPSDNGFFDASAAFIGAFRDQGDIWDQGAWSALQPSR